MSCPRYPPDLIVDILLIYVRDSIFILIGNHMKSIKTTPSMHKNPLFELLWKYLSCRSKISNDETKRFEEEIEQHVKSNPKWLQEIDDEYGQTPLAMAVVNDIFWAAEIFLKSDACDKNPTLYYGTMDEEKLNNNDTVPEPKIIELKLTSYLLSEGNEISPAMKELLWSKLMPGCPNQPLERLFFAMEHGYQEKVDQILAYQEDLAIKGIHGLIEGIKKNKKDAFSTYISRIISKDYIYNIPYINHVPQEYHARLLAYVFTRSDTRESFVPIDSWNLEKTLIYAVEQRSMALISAIAAFHKDYYKREKKSHPLNIKEVVNRAIDTDFAIAANYLMEQQDQCYMNYYLLDLNEIERYIVKAQKKEGMQATLIGLLRKEYTSIEKCMNDAIERKDIDQVKVISDVSLHAAWLGLKFLMQNNEETFLLQKATEFNNNLNLDSYMLHYFIDVCKHGNTKLVTAFLPPLKKYLQNQNEFRTENELWTCVRMAIDHGKVDIAHLLLDSELSAYHKENDNKNLKIQYFSLLLSSAVKSPHGGLSLMKKILSHSSVISVDTRDILFHYQSATLPDMKVLLMSHICQRKDINIDPEDLAEEYLTASDEIRRIIDSHKTVCHIIHAHVLGLTCLKNLDQDQGQYDPTFVCNALYNDPNVIQIPAHLILDIMEHAAKNQAQEVIDALLKHSCWKALPTNDSKLNNKWKSILEIAAENQQAKLVYDILHKTPLIKRVDFGNALKKACEKGDILIVHHILTSPVARYPSYCFCYNAIGIALKATDNESIRQMLHDYADPSSLSSWHRWFNGEYLQPTDPESKQLIESQDAPHHKPPTLLESPYTIPALAATGLMLYSWIRSH